VIKMVMAMRHGVLPRSLYCEEPSPHVDWSMGDVRLLAEAEPWEPGSRPRRAGVSSFGISGTNAHVIVEEAPAAQPARSAPADGPAEAAAAAEPVAAEEAPVEGAPAAEAAPAEGAPANSPAEGAPAEGAPVDSPAEGAPAEPAAAPAPLPAIPLILSARTDAALAAQAERLRARLLDRTELEPLDVAYSLATGRARFERRAALVAADRDELIACLDALAAGELPASGSVGEPRSGKSAFLFTGQGAQWAGMGRDLYSSYPVFAQALDAACAELDAQLGRSLRELVFATEGSPEAELLGRTENTQAALFALEVALYRLFESFGLRPDYLVGHSIGELSAAHVAGVLSLADACVLVAARGRLMGALPEGGAMLAVEADEDELAPTLGEQLSIAAINGPRALVVSGERSAVEQCEAHWRAQGRKTSRLDVSHAFHSLLMEPMLDEFRAVAAGLGFEPPQMAVVSNLTGELATDELTDPGYWVRHVREAVRFADGVRELERRGVTRFIELGPDGVLTAMARGCVSEDHAERSLFAAAMRAEREGPRTLAACAGAMEVAGLGLDWHAFFANRGAQRVDLPTYAFQRERYWLEPSESAGDLTAAGQASAEHPLLGAAVRLAGDQEGWLFTGRLSLRTHPWLADHAVADVVILPGAAFMELALAVADRVGAGELEDLTLVAPLVLTQDASLAVQITVAEADEEGRRPINVYSSAQGEEPGDEDWVLHASGLLGAEGAAASETDAALADFAAASWPPAGAEPVDVETFYERVAAAGYDYGPNFQGMRAAYRKDGEWYAEVALAGEQETEAAGYGVHPALTDAALHTIVLEALERLEPGAAPEVPFSFSGVRLLRHGASSLRVRMRTTQDEDSDARTVRLLALDESGAPALAIEALKARAVDQASLKARASAGNDSLFDVEWVEVPAADTNGSTLNATVLGDEELDLDSPAVELTRHPDLDALAEASAAGAPAPAGVRVRAASIAPADGGLADSVHDLGARMLDLLQSWLASEPLAESRLVLLTDGALAVSGGESPNLAQAALLGLMRSAHSENPGRFGVIDLDGSSTAGLYGALVSGEPELALREGVARAPRLARAGSGTPLMPPEGEAAWQLGIETPGTLESLVLIPSSTAREPLEPGQVRVAMHAAGLNFRDVVVALGLVSHAGGELGGEGAGVVSEVGPGVEGLAPGDRVMGLMTAALGTTTITDARLLAKIPDGWSFAEAASVPIVFMTAYHGLFDLADLKQGEAVLLHGAAGGVGMAAIQLAAHVGAEVFATAHPSKWETVEGLGVDRSHISSSRTLDFKDEVLERTGGRGVDVVLDSLAGEFVDASLDLLPRGGRFIEIGKTDIRDADEVAAQHAGVAYQAFDLLEAGPGRIQTMLSEVVSLFEQGVLHHLPVSTWDLRRGPDAFRHMREAKHVGKIVLCVPQPPERDGTVLITGGTGGLGALVARHLAGEHGARRLVLTSRRGLEAEGAEELVAALAELGCEAEVAACDIADRQQVEALLAAIPAEHPLTAIVHAAGVLDDGVIDSLDGERLRKVMAPKVDGALNLHELTEDAVLSQFVMFSSVASTLGSPGQGNYAAANAFMEALAQHRQARGLPATALAWGAWERVGGMLGALSDADRSRGERMGITALPDEQGLALLDTARAAAQPLLVPARLDSGALRSQAKAGVLPAILQGLVRAPVRRAAETKGSLATRLAAAPESDWQAIVLDLVKSNVGGVLGHNSGDAIDPKRAFKDLGFDSLSAVELRNRLTQATGMRLPTTLVFDHPSPAAVAEQLIGMAVPKAKTNGDSGESELREVLASIPIRRLREAGLLDPLVELARSDGSSSPSDGDGDGGAPAASIDEMDAEALIRMTRGEVEESGLENALDS
jgi:acyl transferase domain-containing protein/NADPH:quinone reductase-like Zn-dependent oxidoreductase/acyl carrier protein